MYLRWNRYVGLIGVCAAVCVLRTWQGGLVDSTPHHQRFSTDSLVIQHSQATKKNQESVKVTYQHITDSDPNCTALFLRTYEDFCNRSTSVDDADLPGDHKRQCPCVPPNLRGRNVSGLREDISVDDLERRHKEVENGGHWQPSARCAPRQRIVVIVPFQNREAHLRLFLKAIHPFLQRQLLDYTIVVVEQVNTNVVFNKAVLMNVGFKEIQSTRDFDCFVFHDVDLLPEDDRNFYTCAHEPRHVGAYIDKWQYSMAYFRVFGGATAFTKQQFEKANGFSTKYYGWGGEDDDMFSRISAVGMKLVRYPKCVATYTSLDHGRDAGNPANPKGGDGLKSMPPHQYQEEGVRQVSRSYQLIGIEKRPLFTRIKIKMKHIT